MTPICNVPTLIERYFVERLMRQRNVSTNTIASYRDTFRLLFTYAQMRLRKPPSALALDDLDAPTSCPGQEILRFALQRIPRLVT